MRNIIFSAILLVLGSLSLAGQDVIVVGGGDFKTLCEGNTIPAQEGWAVLKKNVAAAGLSPVLKESD